MGKILDELNYHVAGLLDTIDALYAKYNAFLYENGYRPKYDLVEARMFVIEGMEKVRKVIEENRQRKLTKHKKISNDTIIEIDNYSPLEILRLQKNLMRIAEGEGIGFVSGKGKHKPEIQKLYEELEECGKHLMEYKECFEIMGKERNSYSKTDLEATFMRMKEDHMLNGQLKPEYNVQIAVENYFIVHSYVSSDQTDYNTLIPVLEKHQRAFGDTLEFTADSGYCSEKNLLHLKMAGSCTISGQKAKNRMDIPRRLRYIDVRTAAAVSVKPGAFINTMRKRILTGIRS